MSLRHLLPIVLIAFLMSACANDSPTSSPATATVPAQAPTATVGPVELRTEPTDFDVSALGGLWAAETTSGSGFLWFALRVTPGQNPDHDAWILESLFPLGVIYGAGRLTCLPTPVPDGWQLSKCEGLPPLTGFEATLRLEGGPALEVYAHLGWDVTATLTRIEKRDEPAQSENVTLVWSHRGTGEEIYSDIWVDAGVVFAPRFGDSIELLDAETGELLSVIDAEAETFTTPGVAAVMDVKTSNGYLFAATQTRGILVYDVRDPAEPRLVRQIFEFGTASTTTNFFNIHNIFVAPEDSLLLAINVSYPNADLRLFDISDPGNPQPAGSYDPAPDSSDSFHDVNVKQWSDGTATVFLNAFLNGLFILELTPPASLQLVGSWLPEGAASHSGWAFELDSGRYYVNADEGYDHGLTIFDVTAPEAPLVMGRFKTRPGISVHNVEVVEGIAYVSYYIDGLRVLDLRDPANPQEIGHFDTVPSGEEKDIVQGAWGVRVWQGKVYVSDLEGGIFALEVEIPGD